MAMEKAMEASGNQRPYSLGFLKIDKMGLVGIISQSADVFID